MIALDASVLIAHLSDGDTHHTAASDVLATAAPGSLLVHRMTMVEVLVGAVRLGRGVQLRDHLRAAGIVVAPPDDEEPLRLAGLRVSTTLTLPDCCALDVAVHQRASLATLDSALGRAARRAGVEVLP